MHDKMQKEVINPVQSKIHRFLNHRTVRGVVSQSSSTINFRELLNERKLLVVNTAAGVIGPDAAGLLGAVIVDSVNFALREQMKNPDPTARTKAIIVIDEFQTLTGVDYESLMAELQKMGGSIILATQSLGQLDEIRPQLRRTILSNVTTLFAFQTSAEDADYLRHELDDAISTTDVINLDDYASYVKSKLEHKRLPVMYVETLAPQPKNQAILAQIAGQMNRYTRSISIAESEWNCFQDQWFGREQNLLDQSLMTFRDSKSQNKPEENREDSLGQAAPALPAPPTPAAPTSDQPSTSPKAEGIHDKPPSQAAPALPAPSTQESRSPGQPATTPKAKENHDELPSRAVPATNTPPAKQLPLPDQHAAESKTGHRDKPGKPVPPAQRGDQGKELDAANQLSTKTQKDWRSGDKPTQAGVQGKGSDAVNQPSAKTPKDKEHGDKPKGANP